MPEKLYGIKVEQYAHPDDIAAMKSLKKIKAVEKFFTFVEDRSNNLYIRMNTLGNDVRLTSENCPRICGLVEEVCEIMDYERVPELYGKRGYSLDIEPSGVDTPILVIPDLLLQNHNDDLLRFNIGRAVTRLKSDSLKIYIASQMLLSAAAFNGLFTDAVKVGVANWMRKSELTADRGGLLACQNIDAAMKFLMNKAGMPLQELNDISYLDYISAYKVDSELAKFGKGMKTLVNPSGWANDRIIELFNWKMMGNYDDLLEELLG